MLDIFPLFENFCPPADNISFEGDYCNSTGDGILCFPATPAGQFAVLPCPDLAQLNIDSSKNASRFCFPNGTWQYKTNYSACTPQPVEDDFNDAIISIIYYVGFSVSTVALLVALFIFLHFRVLKCLRNSIHCHLIVSFILRNVLWFCTAPTLLDQQVGDEQDWLSGDLHTELPTFQSNEHWLCKTLVALFNYFHVTNFFWMFVEGLYLHTMCVWAYSVEKIKLWYYLIIGWGIPAAIIISWAVVKWKYEDFQCWVKLQQDQISYDFIYIAPSLFVLLLNVAFLISIVWILITKLRASTAIQTKHYRKAVKALLVLVPLLGLTWLLFIVPIGNHPTSRLVFRYCNVILESTQGLAVAVFFCFLNGEVRYVINMKIKRWQEHRRLRAAHYMRDSYTGSREQVSLFKIHHKRADAAAQKGTTGSPQTRNYYFKDSGRGTLKSGSASDVLAQPRGNDCTLSI